MAWPVMNATSSVVKNRIAPVTSLGSGNKADERPVRFYLGEQLRMVEDILDQWYGPNDIFFKVRADDGNLYILSTGTSNAGREWSLESFRELNRG